MTKKKDSKDIPAIPPGQVLAGQEALDYVAKVLDGRPAQPGRQDAEAWKELAASFKAARRRMPKP